MTLSELWALILCKIHLWKIGQNIKNISDPMHPLLSFHNSYANLHFRERDWYTEKIVLLRRKIHNYHNPAPAYIPGTASKIVKHSSFWNDGMGGCDGYGCLCDETNH